MGRVLFGRKVQFKASHHYEIKHASAEENAKLFGDAGTIHEHIWELTIWLEGPIASDTGMMVDLVAVDRLLQEEVITPFHNQHFNSVDPFFSTHQPTTEVLASYFAQRLKPHLHETRLVRLRIAESDDLFAEWFS